MRRILAYLCVAAAFAISSGVAAKGSLSSGPHNSGVHSSGHSSSNHAGHGSSLSPSTSHGHSDVSHSATGHGHSKADAGVKRDGHGKVARSEKNKDAFRKSHPCPSTGKSHGACPGYVIDHMQALKHGGADDSYNMQWQNVDAAKSKDRWK